MVSSMPWYRPISSSYMPAAFPPPNFLALAERLIKLLQTQVASGSLTVRSLARRTGISQPHMQNLLNGRRGITIGTADVLLEFLKIGAVDLSTLEELGGALGRASDQRQARMYVPLLDGLLGPAHPFPSVDQRRDWISIPNAAIRHAAEPAFVELGADAATELAMPGARFALLDVSVGARLRVQAGRWYAVRWSGGGWLRRLRHSPRRLVVLGQTALRASAGPEELELDTAGAGQHVAGVVIWLGPDPRAFNPLNREGYLVAPPAADS